MTQKITEWGGDLNNHDARFLDLKKTLKLYSDQLKNIVNMIMFYHWKGTREPGINAFNCGHVKLFDDRWFYDYVKDYVDGGGYLGYFYGGNFTRGGTRSWSQSHPTIATPYAVTMPAGWFSG